ncbi:divergent polysaccharide deacetylase family protein [Aestuariivirga sp.]|uniref:divergent polysaccharide deacetylase family protein n=1 Tax=Aestuariivirga sp. TaxID=2650926 RepID=UPI00391AA86E
MPRDELRQPLRKRSLGERLWAKRPSLFASAAILVTALMLGGGLWIARMPHPFAGEPVVVAAVPPIKTLTTASTTAAEDPPAEESPEDIIDRNAGIAEIQLPDGAPADEAEDPSAPYRDEAAIVMAPHRALKPAPIAAVTEKTEQGPLPRVAQNGKKPFDVYSQVTPLAVTSSGRPKIAIVLGGMGLNQRLTDKAIRELPGDVTFGFAPYGEKLQAQVNKARARGHEILLQVPMEPVGYPGNNPGPNTLLSDAPAKENLAALKWHMSRFAGYAGITNYMGARLLGAEEALEPVMKEVKKRGLVYLEDASVNLTLSQKVVDELRLPMQRASLMIDADPTAPAIAAALAKLEQEAIRNGSAIGTGSGLAVTIETVAEWAKTLQEKGILLVPVSAAYKGRAT